MDEERVLALVSQLAEALPDQVAAARDQALREGLAETVIRPLSDQLIAHAVGRARMLGRILWQM